MFVEGFLSSTLKQGDIISEEGLIKRGWVKLWFTTGGIQHWELGDFRIVYYPDYNKVLVVYNFKEEMEKFLR